MARIAAFLAALLLYALFSTPTPDHIGIVEILVMTGLIAGIGAGGVMQAAGVSLAAERPLWLFPARLLLFFGLTIPFVVGILQGHAISHILRDAVPFLFLLLPLFLTPSFMERPLVRRLFPYVLCAMGLIFAMRVIASFFIKMGAGQFLIGFMPDPDNLVNAPTVLFAALFLTGMGGLRLITARSWKDILIVFCLLLPALLLLAGMAGIGQRAHIGIWAAAVLFWAGLLAVRKPVALMRVLAVCVLAGVLLWPAVSDIIVGLLQKNTIVGLNNRAEEARAVWESFHGQPVALLLGQGWGATIISPAVGPDPVNYTHNLFTTYLLKGGLWGVALVLVYMATLAAGIWRILWVSPVAGVALAGPFLVDITLYASFKSLDFGLLLALIALWTRCPPDAR